MTDLRKNIVYIVVYSKEKNSFDASILKSMEKYSKEEYIKFGLTDIKEKHFAKDVHTFTPDEFIWWLRGKHAVPERLEILVYFYGADDQKTQP